MLRTVLLLFTVVGLHARPSRNDAHRFRNGGWVVRAPQLVQDEYVDNSVHSEHRRLNTAPSKQFLMDMTNGILKEHDEMEKRAEESKPQWELVLAVADEGKVRDNLNQKADPVAERRQGTEPSRRFLIDLNTGMPKDHVSEMDRRVAGFYNYPSNYEFRQGTENSQATLVDTRTGQVLAPLSEMQRGEGKFGAQRSVVEDTLENQKAVPVEFRRQGTEPSRRFLVDLNTGMLKEHISEMSRRVAGFYNPPSNDEFRQGTENSHRTLVDVRTGLLLAHLSEMQRKTSPLYEFRQGTKYSPANLMELRQAQMMKYMERAENSKAKPQWELVLAAADEEKVQDNLNQKADPVAERRQGTEPSRRFLIDLNTGMPKEHVSEMDRRVTGFYNYPSNYEFRQGTENSQATLVDTRTGQVLAPISEMQRNEANFGAQRSVVEDTLENQKAVPVEFRRQGTEPSRRFLVDLNTGMLKEHISEMSRRVAGFYNPPSNYEFRQGTENSHRTLVDVRTGLLLAHLSEMQRKTSPLYELRQGTEYSPANLMELRKAQMMKEMERAENSKGIKSSQDISAQELPNNHIIENIKSNEVVNSELMRDIEHPQTQRTESQKALDNNEVSVEEFRHGMEYSHANIIDNRIMEPAKGKERERVAACQGEVIDGKCYDFNPNLLTFSEAEASCKRLSSVGHLASVTSADLHARIVAMVTKVKGDLVLTWLGGIMKNNQFEWIDGSSWAYTDWMPGHPRTEKHRQSCVEMFRIDESWWTAADCGLKRASICSYPVTA